MRARVRDGKKKRVRRTAHVDGRAGSAGRSKARRDLRLKNYLLESHPEL